jgi:hypothetical protein
LPVGLEDGGHLVDDVGVAGAGDADVPLEAGHLGRVGEARGSIDEPMVAVEKPEARWKSQTVRSAMSPFGQCSGSGAPISDVVTRWPARGPRFPLAARRGGAWEVPVHAR